MNTPSFLLFLYTRRRGASPVAQSQPKIPAGEAQGNVPTPSDKTQNSGTPFVEEFSRPVWSQTKIPAGECPEEFSCPSPREFRICETQPSTLCIRKMYSWPRTKRRRERADALSLLPFSFCTIGNLDAPTCRSAVVLARLGGRLHVTEGELFFEIHIFSWGAPSCHHKVS